MVQTIAPPLRMTYEEYERWVGSGTHSEWVDGEVTIFMPGTPRHSTIVSVLDALLRFYLDLRGLGRVFVAPMEMRLRAGGSYREPDLLVVLEANLAKLTDKRLVGSADIAIEVVSDDDPNRDLVEKFREYREAKIPEYWIVDSRGQRSRFWLWILQPDGAYVEAEPDHAGRLHSTVLSGFWLDPAWFAADAQPNILDCFRAIAPDAFGPSNLE